MPIAFESIQDPLGIASGATLLGKMMYDKSSQQRDLASREKLGELDRQTKLAQIAAAQQADEAKYSRQQALATQQGTTLGNVLQQIGQGGSVSDQLNILGQNASILGPDVTMDVYKQILTSQKPGKETVLGKKIAENTADIIINAPNIANSRSAISRMRELSSQIEGIQGYLWSKYGTKEQAEFDSLGIAAIEPLFKVFNPSGPIATKKMEFLAKTAAPKATDNKEVIAGKLKALERLTDAADSKTQQLMELQSIYGENIPPEEFLKISMNDNATIDKLATQSGWQDKDKNGANDSEQVFDSLPPANKWEGKAFVDDKTNKVYRAKNGKWTLEG